MGYSKEKLIKKCEMLIKDPKRFYADDCVNYNERCTETNEYCTEVIAGFLCEHIDEYMSGILTVKREKAYKTESHLGKYNENSNRIEEITAIKLFNYCKNGGKFDHIGKIIDYQTPLKNKRTDEGIGKIDLLAYDEETNTMRILELKKKKTDETMLRCVLEGFTYMETIKNKEKFLEDFDCPKGTSIKASPFVFAGKESNPYMEMKEERPWLKKLMELLDSKPYYIIEDENGYKVEEEIK